MTASQLEPYSRWRLKDTIDRLAGTYDEAASAVDAFSRSAFGYDPMVPRPTVRARMRASLGAWVARRGWPRATWFMATAILAAGFMAWISVRIVRHLVSGTPPVTVAAVPGLLLTLALIGTAVLTAGGLPRPLPRPGRPAGWPPPAWPRALFGGSLAGCAAWVTIWLTSTAGVNVRAALPVGVVSVVLTGAVLLIACRAIPPARTAGVPAVRRPAPAPRRLLAQQRRAQELLRGHVREWSIAAHQCGAAMEGSAEAEAVLLWLLADGAADQPLTGVGVFHAQLLGSLSRYRPDPLRLRLHEASRNLLPYATRS